MRALALAALLAGTPCAARGQSLQLKTVSPVASMNLSPRLGIPEDSLRMAGRGVWYYDVQVGEGAPIATGDEVSVHFVGFLADGSKFTATDRKPYKFRLGDNTVILGWEDGLPGMKVGGRRQLVVPAQLGYGEKGSGPIPPNAVLVFDITVVDRK